MKYVCFNCGQLNNEENIKCENCEETLIKDSQYEDKCKELKEYDNYKKGVFNILLAIVMTAIMYFGVKYFLNSISAAIASQSVSDALIKYGAKAMAVVFILIIIFPMIIKTVKTRNNNKWTKPKMRSMEKHLQLLQKADQSPENK
ncbi:MAG: hypothetical protein AAGU14_03425 [Eubacteriaceae bacterium]